MSTPNGGRLVLSEYFRYGDKEGQTQIFLANRRRVFDILRRHMAVARLSESLISSWGQLGVIARPEDLQLVLITLVDYLCNNNMFIRQTAMATLYDLASGLNQSTYMLFSPYMRHISIQVLDRSAQNKDFISTFSRMLGIYSKLSFC